MNSIFRILFVMAFFVGSTSAWGSLYRLDFSGQNSAGSVEGFILLDYSAVDVDPDPTRGFFPGLVVGFDMSFNGIRYNVEGVAPMISGTRNGGSSLGDLFGVGGSVGSSDGGTSFFAIQVQDLSAVAFNTDALPTSLNLTDFDPFDIDNLSSTGIIVGSHPNSEFVPIDFIELRQVPVPAAVWLFASALVVSLGRKRSRPIR